MKKVVICLIVVILLGGAAIGVIAIKNKSDKKNEKENKEIVLLIKETTWNGWATREEMEAEAEANAKKEPKEYKVSEGEKIFLGGIERLEITVESVTAEKVVLKTNSPMMDEDNGLNTNKTKFTVKKGEKIKISTPTMDAGDDFEIEYK